MPGRWRIALAGALVVVVALVTGAGPRTGPTPADPAPTPAPQGLVSGLQALDQKISQTIQKVDENELKGSELEKAAGSLRDDLYKLLVDYFPPVFGLPFYKVFNGFLGIDSYINNTAWWAAGNQEKTTSEKDKAVASIDHAKAELKGLQDELTGSGASGVPPALLKGLKHLNEGLTTAAQRARAGSLKLTELSDLNYEKRHLIRDNTQGISLFGQPFAHVEYELESVAYALERVQYGVPFGTTPHKNTAASALRGARYNKEILEDTVVQPVVSISATFYAKGASGACEDTQSDPNFGETCYSVSATPPNAETQLEYRWSLAPPVQDSPPVTNPNPGCVKFHPLPNKAKMFLDAVWHHGDEDGCNHMVEGPNGHMGAISVVVAYKDWTCVAVYLGTNDPDTTTKTGPAGTCFPHGQVSLTVVKMGIGPSGNSRNAPYGNGTVTSSPAGINCDTSCQIVSAGFTGGSQVTLGANPDSSSKFAGWSGAGAGCAGYTGSCTVTMNTNQTVLATFQHT